MMKGSANNSASKLKKKGYLLYSEAVTFAMARYGQNVRKDGTTPQLIHSLRVAEILRNEADVTDWKILASAILHDVIEESVTKYEEIEKEFGKRVARIVAKLTDDKRLPKDNRKKKMLSQLKKLSHEAKLVKLADRLDNVKDSWLRTSKSKKAREIRKGYYPETKKVLSLLKGVCPKLERRLRCEIKLAEKEAPK